MKSVLVILSTVVILSAVALAQSQRDQVMAAQAYQQQAAAAQQQQPQAHHHQAHGDLKSSGSKVTRREYPYDNSYWIIGLCLIPLLILLCFPLFSTPYYGGYGGHHGGHGGHHGGWGWGRSAKDTEQIQERVLKSVEG